MKKQFILFCLSIALLSSCDKDDDMYSAGNENATKTADIITFLDTGHNHMVPADTQTTAVIKLQITPEAGSGNRSVFMATDLGYFLNGKDTITLKVDAEGMGMVQLRSARTGTATVSAVVKGIKIATTVQFVPAMPDDFLMTADKYVIDTSQSLVVKATLSRNPGSGIVSDPVKVKFAVTGTGSEKLVLPAYALSASAVASATLSNPFHVTGTFTIEATAINQAGTEVKKTISIQIK